MKFKYTGKKSINLAQVGTIKPGEVFEVSAVLGAAIERNAPEEFARQADSVAVGGGDPEPLLVEEEKPKVQAKSKSGNA